MPESDAKMTDQGKEFIQEALDEIEYFKGLEIVERGPEWARLWFNLKLDLSVGNYRHVTMPVSSDALLASAARNDPDAFLLAKSVVGSRLRAGAVIPPKLRELLAEWMLGEFEPPQDKRGPSNNKRWPRNFMIRRILHVLSDRHGIRPTRNASTVKGGLVGAEIAHEALRFAGLDPPSIGTIQNIATEKEGKQIHDEIEGFWILDALEDLEPEERI